MKFKHGYEADNHAVNAVPKETLVKFSKAKTVDCTVRGCGNLYERVTHPSLR